MSRHVVIIGAGQAGIQAAATLRSSAYDGRITVISDEASPPYQKPPLSKDFLKDKMKEANLAFRPAAYYEKKDIDLVLGDGVVDIHPEDSQVALSSGKHLTYSELIFATGSRNRLLPIPGSDAGGVHYLRSFTESQQLKEALQHSARLVVIGGGFIGLEIAATARSLGLEVTVLEVADRLMARVLPAQLSEKFEAKHRQEGVEVLTGTAAKAMETKNGKVRAVMTAEGRRIPTELVVIGIGVVPNTALAEKAGIDCDNGILVDRHMKTNLPGIYAIGDCAAHFNPFFERQMRLESVQNAMDQARVAAQAILGRPVPYEDVPWFWTHQYDWKLQMAGCNIGFTHIAERGNGDQLSLFYFKGDHLIGVDSLNRGSDHIAAKKLLTAGVSPTVEQVENEEFVLKSVIGDR